MAEEKQQSQHQPPQQVEGSVDWEAFDSTIDRILAYGPPRKKIPKPKRGDFHKRFTLRQNPESE